jgi:hypothetical protein
MRGADRPVVRGIKSNSMMGIRQYALGWFSAEGICIIAQGWPKAYPGYLGRETSFPERDA